MNWKRFTVFCASFLTFFLAESIYVFSCGGGEADPYDYYTNFFNPNVASQNGFEPFYYTGLANYYGREEDEETLNLRNWHAFFGGKATEADIREFIYTYSRPQMAALYNHIEKGAALQLPDSVQKNTLTRHFIGSKDRETLGYLMFAKQCEPHTGGGGGWEAPVRDTLTMLKLSRNGVQLYKACKNEQIRERYAFQTIRLAHYGRDYRQALRYYDSLAAPISSTSLIHYKSLALKAGALMRTGNKTESAYLFSRVFGQAPSLREMAYTNTGWAGAPESEVMRRCANTEEKATVAAMYACRVFDPHPQGIRNVYRLSPQSPMMDVLLGREINKLEDSYLYNRLSTERFGNSEYGYSNATAAEKSHVTALQQLLDSLAAGGKVKEPALWQLSSAYLSYMVKDYPGAHKRLSAAKAGAGPRAARKDQWEIVRLRVTVEGQNPIGKDCVAPLLESFRWLDSKLDTTRKTEESWYYDGPNSAQIDRDFYFRMYRNLLNYVVATRYIQQGDVTRQALIFSKRDKVEPYGFYGYNTSAHEFVKDSLLAHQLIELYNLQQQKKKTPFEQYLCKEFIMTDNEVGEAIAVSYVRQHDFANAVTWFKKSGSSRKAGLAFTPQLQDYGLDSSETVISQLEYATTMLELEKKMKSNKATAEDYFQYATGLFSISYYGHAYQLSADYRPSTSWYNPVHENRPDLKQYYGCYRAEEYYKKAADASTNREFKARALFMAARCAQKHLYDEKTEWYYLASEKNPHFPELVKNYSNTAFYKETFNQCGYLRDFVYMQKK